MNPYGQFFGVPQYYGAIPPNYQSFLSTGLVGYTPVAAPPPSVTVSQPATTQPSTTEASITQVVVTQEKTPVTTVFVGNIPERAPDSLVKSLLMRCGNILSWKRVQGASGKLQAFGFCEYQDPESTMRCVRLLNGFEILEKKLMVKVDPKTEDLLNEYRKKKRKDGEDGNLGSTEAEVDDETKKDDDVVKTALQNILQEAVDTYQLGHESPNRNEYLEGPRHLTLDDMDIDGERKDLINKEIETFRRRNEKETPSEERGKRSRELDYYTSRYSSRNLSRSDRDSERGSRYSRSRSRSREPPKKRPRGGITSSTLISEKHYRSSQVDEEEEAIKKRLERKLKEKEESYQNRLRQWESRERKKHAEYEREKEREKKKQEEIRAEAKNLLDFFITYDDDVEDSKFYKGSAFQRRLTDREVEETADERDRQKELEVFESSSRKLIEEEDPNAESIILQMEQAMQEHLQKRLNLDAHTPIDQTSSRSGSKSRDVSPAPQSVSGFVEAPVVISAGFKPVSPDDVSRTSDNATPKEVSGSEPSRKDSSTFLFSMSSKPTENVLKPAAAFTDEDVETKSKRPALSWLPPSSDKATTSISGFVFPDLKAVANLPTSEKRAIIKQIIERIPTSREELFAYPIDWKAVDSEFVKERIKPWVDKKIITYLGEAEATLSNFICEQVLEHKPPGKILADVALVLEEEAEVFVVKMWRLLIYVIAEKNLGLTV
ncbi:RNA-binding protein 25 [Taenia solium]|eukprot:TsM_001050600 transcript=TsM_001050600 gene=TsM_001050600